MIGKSGGKKAFTLAEVLISLVIIGVIAAITVPTMIKNYQKEEIISKLKKVYSTLSQTTLKAMADNGPPEAWEINGSGTFNSAKEAVHTYLFPYLSVVKICEANNNKDVCKIKIKGLNGTDVTNSKSPSGTSYRFYLADGTFISTMTVKDSKRTRLVMTIDINGTKGPNVMGKDVFRLEYYMAATDQYANLNGKFVPTYVNYTRSDILSNKSDRCNKKQNGDACFALIYKDGWQMKSDYPW
jgi:prepilin-type N-terminal cleavage/methylation domain-containing protein